MTSTINIVRTETNDTEQLFKNLSSNEILGLESIQLYVPIYSTILGEQVECNTSISHKWNLSGVLPNTNTHNITDDITKKPNTFGGLVKNTDGQHTITKRQQIFFKTAPLIEPYRFLYGKYGKNPAYTLPTNSIRAAEEISSNPKQNKINTKLNCHNNSAYTDGFFSFLISTLFTEFDFIHGIEYYGTFLAIKNKFEVDIIDDLEGYLNESIFFNAQKGKLFDVENYDHLALNDNSPKTQPPITFLDANTNMNMDIDIDISTEISEFTIDNLIMSDVGIEEVDISDESNEKNKNCTNEVHKLNKTESEYSDSDSDSSNGSSISVHSIHDESDDENTWTNSESDSESDSESESESDSESKTTNDSSNSQTSSSIECEDEKIIATIPKFPVQLICMSACENTLQHLIDNEGLKTDEEWFSVLMQIIMILITYDKSFSFTHNDLHTNNVMYVSTHITHIYYLFEGITYRVPTFGKIFKLIDFGRAIYKFQNKIYCSDSYQPKGEAACQYNTEPYFNEKRRRVDPNPSFDLCRFGCALIDCFFADVSEFENTSKLSILERIIVDWCTDDDGANVLYNMTTGNERYESFDLHVMIARNVHAHTPLSQLNRPIFKKYIVSGADCIGDKSNSAYIPIDNYCKQYI